MEMKDVRFRNFTAIRNVKFRKAADLAKAIDRMPNQVNDMLKNKKSFGEKLARDIESHLGLLPYDLDMEWDGHEWIDNVAARRQLQLNFAKLNEKNQQAVMALVEHLLIAQAA